MQRVNRHEQPLIRESITGSCPCSRVDAEFGSVSRRTGDDPSECGQRETLGGAQNRARSPAGA